MLYTSTPVIASPQGEMKVTLAFKDAPLSTVFKNIEKQTGLVFMYNTNQVRDSYRVSIYVKQTSLNEVLKNLLSPQGITWEFRTKTVVLKPEKTDVPMSALPPDSAVGNVVSGEVKDQNGMPLPGAFIYIKATRKGTISNEKGVFTLNNVPNGAILLITYTGYVPQQINANGNRPLRIMMDVASNKLDEAVVMAYGVTSRRMNTGSISKVTAEEISRQPVSNPLAALDGRVPGMLVTQSSGAPGASVKVQIRGQNSLVNGTEPLYIIDGIPFAPNNDNINNVNSLLTSSSGAGLSPFSMINPADIESIEVLKDADATSIYGSRGANGVVLITTKKGKSGKATLQAVINTGFSRISRGVDMLNTKEYVAMRKEAFKNDGITPNNDPGTAGYAPDLMVWDTTRYTDIKKILLGGTAKILNATLSLSGGNQYTQFLVSGSFHRETTVLPADGSDSKPSLNFNLNHTSNNQKFNLSLSSIANFDNNNLPVANGFYLFTPPNMPNLYNAAGQLNWQENGAYFQNPLADLLKKYNAITNNYLTSLTLSYKILPGLTARVNTGFNILNTRETQIVPISSLNPSLNQTGTSAFGSGNIKSWIIEPQLEYTISVLKGKLNILAGGTWQDNRRDRLYLMGNGYTSDNLINSIAAAPNIVSKVSDDVKYRYEAAFTRLNYSYANKYILNLSCRRDGSSRFGPNKRFSNFGSAGIAWIFSNERLISQNLPFLSFGKLRGSYGITGNDQVGDYKYLPTWTTSTLNPYQGGIALKPDNLFNPDFYWEGNKKLEVALDLGFLKDRFLVSASFYKSYSNNQLVNYPLPSQTGFTSIVQNLPALITNQGIELDLNGKIINNRDFKWIILGNITIPSNTLVRFPNLSSSSYANQYEIGRSINILKLYKSYGVDPKTGLYTFHDINSDGMIDTKDLQYIGKTNPDYFGSVGTELSYKGLQISTIFTFRKQLGRNFFGDISSSYLPGMMYNQPSVIMNRWQHEGDNAQYQKFSATTSSDAYRQASLISSSSGAYSDASFIRMKNISISYSLPDNYLKRWQIKSCKLFLQGQNLVTITDYIGDPETQSLYAVPPLKTIALGLQLTL